MSEWVKLEVIGDERTLFPDTGALLEATKVLVKDGFVQVPDGPGQGVTLDREKLARYHELYRELGSYTYDRDPGRPGWFSHVPNRDWADPADARVPALGR